MMMCVRNFSALHHPERGLTGVVWNGRPSGLTCGCMYMSFCQGHWKSDGGGGVRWAETVLHFWVWSCVMFQGSLCMYTSMVILLYFPCWCPHFDNLFPPITPPSNMLSDEIIEWDSVIMSTVHMPDIKSHHYEVGAGSLVGPSRT